MNTDPYFQLHDAIGFLAAEMPSPKDGLPREWLPTLDLVLAGISRTWRDVKRKHRYVTPRGRKRLEVSPAKARELSRAMGQVAAARELNISRTTLCKLIRQVDG